MLTPSQLLALKNLILGDPTLNSNPNNSDGNSVIVQLLSNDASPSYWVWRTNVTRAEIYHETSPDGTTWNWDTYKAQNVTEQNAWVQMFMSDEVNFAKPNLRAGVASIFSGNAAQNNQRAHCLAVGRRVANRAEKLFAVATVGGVGTRGSTANPDTMTVEGILSVDDVQAARNLA